MNEKKPREPRIEILVAEHKPSFVPKNKFIKAIQVGTAINDIFIGDADYHDSDLKNISNKNQSYGELTATYWAWKNIEADYYGLFHYRRYFNFEISSDDAPYATFRTALKGIERINLQEDCMEELILTNDVIIPKKADVRDYGGDTNLYSQYEKHHFASDLDFCLTHTSEKFPEIAKYNDVTYASSGYFFNMLIAKKEIFDEYCTFLFEVLESFEKNRDFSNYNPDQYRVIGYLGERLTNIFIHYLQGQNKYKICELQTVTFENTEPITVVSPAYSERNVAIVFPTDDFYIPYVSTILHSLVDSITTNNNYDINIFNRNVTKINQKLLKTEFEEHTNISIRFVDMSPYSHLTDDLFETSVIPMETYFRLFIPYIMKDYNKVLYLDDDMIVKYDVANLFSEDVEGYLLGAVHDIDMAAHYNATKSAELDNTLDKKRDSYLEKKLLLKNPMDYFQAGVLLLNLEEIRKQFELTEFLEYAKGRWLYQDQDILNHFAQGQVKFLDWRWNVQYDWEHYRIKNVYIRAPHEMYGAYIDSRKDPYIIHFSGSLKPWHRPDCDFGVDFWLVARKSIYYEIIMYRLMDTRGNVRDVVRDEIENHIVFAKVIKKKFFTLWLHFLDSVAPQGTARRKVLHRLSK